MNSSFVGNSMLSGLATDTLNYDSTMVIANRIINPTKYDLVGKDKTIFEKLVCALRTYDLKYVWNCFSRSIFSLLKALQTFALLPSIGVFIATLVFAGLVMYKTRKSNPMALFKFFVVTYIANLLLITVAIAYVLSLSGLVSYLVVFVAAIIVITLINISWKESDIHVKQSKRLRKLGHEIKTLFKKEPNLEHRLIRIASLNAMKEMILSSEERNSIEFTYAKLCTLFVELKYNKAIADKTDDAYESLNDETEQALHFIAKARYAGKHHA